MERPFERLVLAWLPAGVAIARLLAAPIAPVGWIADSVIYVGQAQAILNGSVPSGRYPPGLAVVLAAGGGIGLRPEVVMAVIGTLLVVAVVVAARRLAGWRAGAVAGVLCCVCPWLMAAAGNVMSDSLAALLAVVGLLAATEGRARKAGVVAVLGVLVRLTSVVGVVAAGVVSRRAAVVALAVSALAFGGFQWAASGSPFSTGYSTEAASWAPGYALDGDRVIDGDVFVHGGVAKASVRMVNEMGVPNVLAYPALILGVPFFFGPPLLSAVGLWAMWRRRRAAEGRYAAVWLVGSTAMLVPYFAQAGRLLAPAMVVLLVFTAVGVADLAGWSGDLADHHVGVHLDVAGAGGSAEAERALAGQAVVLEPDGRR